MLVRMVSIVSAVSAVLALGGVRAAADDCGFSVDFEDFDADLRPCGPDFELKVKYEVEFDHSRRDDRFVLLLEPSECGRALVDGSGQAISFVVPLDCPKKWEHKDRDYEGTARFSIPGGAVRCPEDVRVQASVIHENEDVRVACKDRRVDFDGCIAVVEPVVVVDPQPVVVVEPRPVVVVQPRPAVVVHRRPVVVHHRPHVVHHRVVRRVHRW
jgi:hypothetical protein